MKGTTGWAASLRVLAQKRKPYESKVLAADYADAADFKTFDLRNPRLISLHSFVFEDACAEGFAQIDIAFRIARDAVDVVELAGTVAAISAEEPDDFERIAIQNV